MELIYFLKLFIKSNIFKNIDNNNKIIISLFQTKVKTSNVQNNLRKTNKIQQNKINQFQTQ